MTTKKKPTKKHLSYEYSGPVLSLRTGKLLPSAKKKLRLRNPFSACAPVRFGDRPYNARQGQVIPYHGVNMKVMGCGDGKDAKRRHGKRMESTYALLDEMQEKMHFVPKSVVQRAAYQKGIDGQPGRGPQAAKARREAKEAAKEALQAKRKEAAAKAVATRASNLAAKKEAAAAAAAERAERAAEAAGIRKALRECRATAAKTCSEAKDACSTKQKNPSRPRLTLATVRDALSERGMSIRKNDGEYRINFIGGREATAYFTNDLSDALATGRAMAQHGRRSR
jgi:hypothetical protein